MLLFCSVLFSLFAYQFTFFSSLFIPQIITHLQNFNLTNRWAIFEWHEYLNIFSTRMTQKLKLASHSEIKIIKQKIGILCLQIPNVRNIYIFYVFSSKITAFCTLLITPTYVGFFEMEFTHLQCCWLKISVFVFSLNT